MGGDVVDLWAAQEGPFGNAVYAMQDLAEKFGVKLWREEDFHTGVDLARIRAERRAKRALEDAMTRCYFDRWVVPAAEGIDDRGERRVFLDRALQKAGLA